MLTNSNELIGRALGTCTLKRLVGRGGMGAVYLAQQSRPRRTVAVKVLLPHLVEARPREEFLARFRREADAIAALDHINIMPIYEYGEQGEAAYLVMPYVMGGTLRERLEVQPIPPIQDVVSIVEQVAAGLDSAHALGIIHRDLKPGNILFHADGRVLITDFGLAKMLKDAKEQDSGANALTSAGSIIGTPEYLSPEQGTGNPTDYHTDVYSLGVVLYQMLAGRVPFTGVTPVAVAIKHALQEPSPITDFNPAIPHSIEAVALKALAKAPEQRFASAGELARALRQAISNESAIITSEVPDTQHPPATPIITTDSPQLAASTKGAIDQEAPLQAAEKTQEKVEENKTENDQNAEKQALAEAQPGDQEPQENSLQQKVTNLPTLVMKPDAAAELYDSPTVEGPPTGMQDKPMHAFASASTLMDVDDQLEPKAFHQQAKVPAFLPEKEQSPHPPAPDRDRTDRDKPLYLRDGEGRVGAVPGADPGLRMAPRPNVDPRPMRSTPSRPQSGRLRFIVSLLALLIVIGGGFAAYQHLSSTQPSSSAAQSGATATVSGQAPGTPPQDQTPAATPPLAAIAPKISAGRLLYSTPQPFSACDKQGGHWTTTAGASVTCGSGGSQMTNASGRLAADNLDQLAGNQYPWPSQNFIVQVQATITPNSQGAFGIDFPFLTSDNSQEYFAYLLDQSGNWSFNHYDAQGHLIDSLVSGKLLSSMSTNVTIDIRVEGTSYAFYVNGVDTTGRASTGSQYADKIVGLAVDANARATFSNFAIYSLS